MIKALFQILFRRGYRWNLTELGPHEKILAVKIPPDKNMTTEDKKEIQQMIEAAIRQSEREMNYRNLQNSEFQPPIASGRKGEIIHPDDR